GEVTDRGVALLEQPLGDAARLGRPGGEAADRDQALGSIAAEKVYRPRRVRRLSIREIPDHGVDLLTRARRLVAGGDERGKAPHATMSSPATARSCSSVSPSPSQ